MCLPHQSLGGDFLVAMEKKEVLQASMLCFMSVCVFFGGGRGGHPAGWLSPE